MHKLSTTFIDALKNGGVLFPMLQRVLADNTLDLEIRENYVNIYYRGGNLIKITGSSKNNTFIFESDPEYFKGKQYVKIAQNVSAWITQIPALKEAMDIYFTAIKGFEEREFQQLVARDNNNTSIANGTDYFVIDIEYDNQATVNKSRFDLIALKWESNGMSRQNKRGKPSLAFIEMKYGEKALADKSTGMMAHLTKFEAFVNNGGVQTIANEMACLFEQKRELNLITSLVKNKNVIKLCTESSEFEYIFLLSNHDPASSKLTTELNKIEKALQSGVLTVSPKFCVSNFMGYGLYKENIYTLDDFKKRFFQQIYSR